MYKKMGLIQKSIHLICLLILPIICDAFPIDHIKVEIMSYSKLPDKSVLKGQYYIDTSYETDFFFEVKVRLTNTSKKSIDLKIKDILLEGNGEYRSPRLMHKVSAFLTYDLREVYLKPGKPKERILLFDFPEQLKPTFLLLKNKERVPINKNKLEDITYFNEYWERLPTRAGASYYREIKNRAPYKWMVKDYYLQNKSIKSEMNCSSLTPLIKHGLVTNFHINGKTESKGYYYYDKKDGEFSEYYESGALKEKGSYYDNKMDGLFETYYQNGLKRESKSYSESGMKMLQFWNEKGDSLLIDGNGIAEFINEQGNTFVNSYKNHICYLSYQIRNKEGDKVYEVLKDIPAYKGGLEIYVKGIRKTLKYPREAKRNNIQGKVYIQFIVDEKGITQEVEVIKGIGGGCDEEAKRVIKLMNSWNPGKVDGKAVKSRMVIPISFKLG